MTDELKAPGGLESSEKTVDPANKVHGAETTKESPSKQLVDDLKTTAENSIEKVNDELANLPTVEQVQATTVDKVEASKSEVKGTDVGEVKEAPLDQEKQESTVSEKADEVLKNGDSTSTKDTSDRVRDGQRWNKRDFKKNVKSDLTSQEESSDPVAIRKQVEFYFSNSNLLQDQFLYSKVEGHLNLPVPISIIASFQRMRRFKPHSAIVAALKESKVLNVVENDSCVQRKEALPENFKDKSMNEVVQVHEDEAMGRSIYAKGFGEEKPSTQFDIEAYFAGHGPTNSVRLRRTYDRKFKGSVFVEFDSEETQQKFLALDPKPKWRGSELLIKSKKEYCEEKVEDIKNGRVKPNTHWQPHDTRYKSGEQRAKEGDRDWRDRRNEDQKGGSQDKRGRGRKGFGSAGRGARGGGRGRGGARGGRDNRGNGRDNKVPKIATTSAAADDPPTTPELPKPAQAPTQTTEPNVLAATDKTPTTSQAAASTSFAEPSAKKRAREADEGDETQSNTKKIDIKAGES